MKLKEIQKEYDVIFSLGNNCLPAMKLREHDLRRFAGPLDWVGSPNLSKVTNLLKHNFSRFLELENLRGIQYVSDTDILVLDELNHISFNHDFKTDRNTLDEFLDLPLIKEKYERRIKRFQRTLEEKNQILFIRTEGTIEEVMELQTILKEKVKGDFSILLINHTDVTKITEIDWDLENVCVLELPNEEIWEGNNHCWKEIFESISLRK